MVAERQKRKTGLDPIKVFRPFPRANHLFRASLAAFAIFNGALLVVSKLDPAILLSWIKLSQPVTASIARVWPAIDWAAGELQKIGGVDFIPAVRNILAFDFILFVISQVIVIPVSLIDLTQYKSRVCAGMDALVLATGRSLLWFVVVYGIITLMIAVMVYLGTGVRPHSINLQTNYLYFTFAFLVLDTFVPATVIIATSYCLKWRSAAKAGVT
jgi:hypothetical protein